MYLNKTIKKFFIKDGSNDIYWFIFGLLFLFSFAYLYMPGFIICLGLGILTSSVFRYITTDAVFYDELNGLNQKKDKIDYIVSKNIFTILFVGFMILILYLVVGIISEIFLPTKINFEFKLFFTLIFYILGAENIILIFSQKRLSSYDEGYKRNLDADLRIGLENLKSMLPSLFVNICLGILIFNFQIDLNIIKGTILLFISIIIIVISKATK